MTIDYQAVYSREFSLLNPQSPTIEAVKPLVAQTADEDRRPAVVRPTGGECLLFGPDVEDFNEFDDPC